MQVKRKFKMPIYEYKCNKCDTIFEELVFGSQTKEEVKCPLCNSSDVSRKTSSFAAGSVGASSHSGAGHSCGSS